MAQHILNTKMEFFYSDDDFFDKLIVELNNRFSYQKVVFITENNNIENSIKEKRKNIVFYPEIINKQDDVQYEKDVVCVVYCCNENILQNRKKFLKSNVYFIVYLEKYSEIYNFSNELTFDNNSEVLTPILGVVLDTKQIKKNEKIFEQNICFEYISFCFYVIENQLCRYFFSKSNMDLFEYVESVTKTFFQSYNTEKDNLKNFYDLYFDLIIKVNMFDCFSLNFFDKKENSLEQNIYYKAVVAEIIINVYKIFIEKIEPCYVGIINSNNMQNYEICNCFINNFDEQKFWFIKNKFKSELNEYIDDILKKIIGIKNITFKIDIDYIYNLAKNIDLSKIKNQLKQLAFSSKQENFLKIIAEFGLLDFE